jgi:hypothetical protein
MSSLFDDDDIFIGKGGVLTRRPTQTDPQAEKCMD